MIKFFRNIRQTLMMENKTGKPAAMPSAGKPAVRYLKYAIGEIVLVVIGILIALQINNWNENRKSNILEKKLLSELAKSLEGNCNAMIQDSLLRITWNTSSNIVIAAIENNLGYSDSLQIHFQNARKPGTNLALSSSGYESLKNAGFNILSSDILRNNIIELFELTQKRLLEEMTYFESFQPDRQTQIDKLFSYDDTKFNPTKPFDIPLIPHDYNKLKHDITYLSMIKSVKVQRNIIGVILNRNLKESQRVLQLIKNELNEN